MLRFNSNPLKRKETIWVRPTVLPHAPAFAVPRLATRLPPPAPGFRLHRLSLRRLQRHACRQPPRLNRKRERVRLPPKAPLIQRRLLARLRVRKHVPKRRSPLPGQAHKSATLFRLNRLLPRSLPPQWQVSNRHRLIRRHAKVSHRRPPARPQGEPCRPTPRR